MKRFALGILGACLALPLGACAVSSTPEGDEASVSSSEESLKIVEHTTPPPQDSTKLRVIVLRSSPTQQREVGGPTDPTEPDPSPWTGQGVTGDGPEPDPSPWSGTPNTNDPNHPAVSPPP